MRPVYGDKCFTKPAIRVHAWYKSLVMDHGRETVVDEELPGRRRRFILTTDATSAAVDSLMRSDRRVMG